MTPIPEPVRLRTSGLILEPLRVDHAAEMTAVLADVQLYEFTGGEPPDVGALTARYRRQVSGSGRDDEQWFNWIVRHAPTSAAIGHVQATVTAEGAEVAWLIGTSHQRQGFAREAAAAMVEWLADNGVERFTAHIAGDHVGSAKVATALGLKRTGAVDDEGEQIWATQVDHGATT